MATTTLNTWLTAQPDRVSFVQEALTRSYAQLTDTENDTMLAPIYDLESTTIVGAVTIMKAQAEIDRLYVLGLHLSEGLVVGLARFAEGEEGGVRLSMGDVPAEDLEAITEQLTTFREENLALLERE